MDMKVIGDQAILSGGVERGDERRLAALLDRAGQNVRTVILRNSNGGDANAGYAIGDLIRKRGLNTAVAGHCMSSCSRMFLGGVQRQITDEEAIGRTYVGFHSNYRDDGSVVTENVAKLRAWIIEHSDGKADKELVDRWTVIPNRKGYMYFFDSTRLKRNDGISMFLCSGNETGANRFNQCEKIVGKTGYDVGVFTSSEIVKVNQSTNPVEQGKKP